jgi:tetratricopeptide (TPR) repeat protein
MDSKRVLVLGLLLAVLAAVGAWRMGWLSTTPVPQPLPPKAPGPPRFQAAWATEEEWLVDRITRHVRELAALAASRSLVDPAAPAVKPEALRFEKHLFSPRPYEPLAREALGPAAAGRPAADEGREGARLLAVLLDPRTAVLVREGLSLSRGLTAQPRDAGAHERAALLLAAFALRDCAGPSTDIRPALVRLTAHLALARALRGDSPPGLAGRFAEAGLATLVGRERDALARLDALEAAARTPAERAWVRALRLRNTGDWRIARDAKGLSLLERLEEYRALVEGQDDGAALAWLDRGRAEDLPDWGAIALDSPSVETANRFADVTPVRQLVEAAEVRTALHGALGEGEDLIPALNERSGPLVARGADGEPRVEVLDWGLWADRAQRHLAFGLMQGYSRYIGLLGLPGEGRAYAERARERFGRLDLYPLVLRCHAHDADSYRTAMAAVRELALRSPERLTAGHWALVRAKVSFARVPGDLPDERTWFRPPLPAGTLLDAGSRFGALAALGTIGAEELRTLRDLAPHNVALALFAGDRQPAQQRSPADLAAVYGPLADYHVRIMGKVAFAAWYDTDEFRKRQGAMCEIAPRYCYNLGHRLAELGLADEAAVAYRKGLDRDPDRVGAANTSRWLVDYYFDHGRIREAEAIAREAAETYSGQGLFVMARLEERRGRLAEAEEYYRRILDRYDSAQELAGFYYRQARVEKKAAYEPKLRDALARALPAGLEPLDRASLKAPPVDGVVVKGENDNTKKCRIKWGHVIVGLDGYRVRDWRAYDVVRALSQSPRMKLVVWRGASYDDVEVELWDRWFRVDLDTYAHVASPSPSPPGR